MHVMTSQAKKRLAFTRGNEATGNIIAITSSLVAAVNPKTYMEIRDDIRFYIYKDSSISSNTLLIIIDIEALIMYFPGIRRSQLGVSSIFPSK